MIRYLVGAVVLIACLVMGQSGVLARLQPDHASNVPVALAAALHDVDGGGNHPGSNTVGVLGTHDLRLTFRGSAQVGVYHSKPSSAKNVAVAVGSCNGCVNFAVALQMIFVTPSIGDVANTSKAVAVNVECPHCTTVAISVVYLIITPHPQQAANRVHDAIDRINDQFDTMAGWSRASLPVVTSQLSNDIQQFADAAVSAALGSAAGTPSASPNIATPRPGAGTPATVLPGGLQVIPALPGAPKVDVQIGQ